MKPATIHFVLAITVSTICSAQNSKGYLLALSKGEHVMAVIDPATLKIITKVPVGSDPHEIIASTDGRTAYVTNTGGGRAHEINVIDLVAQKALPNIDTKSMLGPHGIVFVAGKAWFSAEGSKSVAI